MRLANLSFPTKTRTGGMMELASSGILSGLLMVLGGTSVFLQGTGRLPVSKNSEKQATWLTNIGPIFKVGGPIMVVSGLLKLFLSL